MRTTALGKSTSDGLEEPRAKRTLAARHQIPKAHPASQ